MIVLLVEVRDAFMDYKDLVQTRRSHRKFTDEPISAEDVQLIMRAALMAPTGHGQRAWQFVVVDDPLKIEQLADAKDQGAQFLKGAPLCIAVLGDGSQNDCWIEDGAIAAYSMLLQAEDLGLGGCWAQMRNRGLSDGTSAEVVVRGILDIPENMNVLCVLGIGHKAMERKIQDEEKLKWEQVRII